MTDAWAPDMEGGLSRPKANNVARYAPVVAGLLLLLATIRIWDYVCESPGQEWNDVKLRASFLIADGLPLYPGIDFGPITTWMYGPVFPLIMLPTSLFASLDNALLCAAFINVGMLITAIAFTCLGWPSSSNENWSGCARLCGVALSLLLLPEYHLVFLLPDNAALSFGLISITALARANATHRKCWWFLAAGCAGAAAFSKLHGAFVIVAELGWIWHQCNRGQMFRFARQLAIVIASMLVVTCMVSSSPKAAWEMSIMIPSRLPFTHDWGQRLSELMPYYFLMVVVPGTFVFWSARFCRACFATYSLPAYVWLASLPFGLASSFTWGGAQNSLHGGFYLLPLMLTGFTAQILKPAKSGNFFSHFVIIGGLSILLFIQWRTVADFPKKPQVAMPLEAVALSRQLGERLWIPWRPLATRFAIGRHLNDEDGLYVRQLTGLFPGKKHVDAYVPTAWDTTLFQVNGMNWDVALHMRGEPHLETINHWVVVTYPTPFTSVQNK